MDRTRNISKRVRHSAGKIKLKLVKRRHAPFFIAAAVVVLVLCLVAKFIF